MPLPPDSVFVTEATDSPEDPFGLFPSEDQKVPFEVQKVPSEVQKVPSDSQRAPSESQKPVPVRPSSTVHTSGRRFVVLTIALLVRLSAVLVTASRRVVRFAAAWCVAAVSAIRRLRPPSWHLRAWHLPKWRVSELHLPAWRLPAWRLPARRLPAWRLPAWRFAASRTRAASVESEARPFVRQIAARTPISALTLSAFAFGVIAGGSAVWLSGASRNAGVQSTASPRAPLDVSRAEASRVAPVGTGVASTTRVQGGEPTNPKATSPAGVRRPLFRGSLVVNSRPSGARVFLNGRSVGQTPLVLRNQPAGSRAVRVDLDGYEPWSSAVRVVADAETRLRAELKMQRPAAQP